VDVLCTHRVDEDETNTLSSTTLQQKAEICWGLSTSSCNLAKELLPESQLRLSSSEEDLALTAAAVYTPTRGTKQEGVEEGKKGDPLVFPTPHTSPGQETEAVVTEDSGWEAMQCVHGWTHLLRVLSLWPLRCLLQLCKEARQMPCLQATHWPRPVCVYEMMWLRIGRGVLYTVDQSYVAALHLFSSQTEKQIQYFHDTCSIITVNTTSKREPEKKILILWTSDPSVYVTRKCVSDEGDVQLLIVSRGHLSESFLW